jgi:transcriptional regulator with XRE-family HTH domain
LAEDLHTDQAQVSAWERDKARPSKAILGALAAHFQIDLTLLDSGDEFLAWLQRPQVEPSSSPLPPFPELPDPGAGGRLLIDRTRGDIRPVEGMEALQLVMGAMHEGRKVWILIE